jgi:hypothetical protein
MYRLGVDQNSRGGIHDFSMNHFLAKESTKFQAAQSSQEARECKTKE